VVSDFGYLCGGDADGGAKVGESAEMTARRGRRFCACALASIVLVVSVKRQSESYGV